ncbi:HlyC/CorC family transporter [Tessaracoccus rhinocerotis]|uniref:HlyC/CorC family transporter n=1 Tax=Tessaracoccus rhinocerotis TaxID=1689449 RepID=A0A553JYX7_9ACTN|nr:hemolysin family protein [Tessaracoccus rhinocerotis]TRY17668.1 HlyC/CorC family transporter [Tessaracoccus rhinocerotis]
MTPVVSLLVGLVVVLLITVATGYFVAQEFAYMAVDRSKLQARAAAGDAAAARSLDITRRTSFMLSGAQLGITVTGLLVGYVAEPLIGQALAELAPGATTAIAVGIGGVLAIAYSTFIQMLFGELFPKNYSIANSTKVAGWLARSTQIYLAIFGPLIWVFDRAAEGLLKLLRIQPVHDVEHSATARDLERLIDASRETGDLSPELSILLDRILDFPNRDAEHAMIPRPRIDVVRAGTPTSEVRELMATGHTRYPVVDEDDKIIGIIHLTHVLSAGNDRDRPIEELAAEPLVVAESMALPDALTLMDEAGEQLACVVDEYGGFAGIITIEDLAEEVVGDITDEHDPSAPEELDDLGEGVWQVSGEVHVDEVERTIHQGLPRGDYETVAGLVIQHFGGLPKEGDTTRVELPPSPEDLTESDPEPRFLTAKVLEIDNHVPSLIELTMPESGDEGVES